MATKNQKTTTIIMEPEKATKNCVKFVEKQESEFLPELLGTLYVQKSTLAGLTYTGEKLCVILYPGKGDGIVMTPEKPTKNTWKFNEVVENEFVPEKIGSVYVPRATLAGMGYTGGEITVKLSIAK